MVLHNPTLMAVGGGIFVVGLLLWRWGRGIV